MAIIDSTGGRDPSSGDHAIELRPIEAEDSEAAARIVFEAFAGIHDHHRFSRDFPTPESASGLVDAFVAHPSIWGVVAVRDGQVVGSNFLDERGPIRGVGPITVAPAAQGLGVGRSLMQAVIERASGAAGVRLLQDAFNTASLSLYASLGFEVTDPIALLAGNSAVPAPAGVEVRALREGDVAACEELHVRVHGYERTVELRDALAAPHLDPTVVIRDGRVVAYATTLTFFPAAYAVAEGDDEMMALIAGTLAATENPASFLLPVRQAALLRACLDAGLRVVKPMSYMVIGEHREASGAWIPSVLY